MWQTDSHLIYDTLERERVLQAIPEACALHNGYVAFPRTLHNCQMARWLGLPVPPILDAYDWPINPHYAPLAHQKLVANFQVLHPKSFNLSDMGTMKTLSALWAADYLMGKHPGWRALIVCPRSIRQKVWGDEIFANLLGRRTFSILEGDPKKRLKALAKPADFYIVNYDGLKIGAKLERTIGKRRQWTFTSLSKAILEREDLRIIIIDEAEDAYKDGNTDRSRVARRLLCHRDYLWLLTGTPTPNGPADAHGLALFINNAGGESYSSFYRRTMVQLSQYKWVPHRTGYEEAYKLLTPAIRIDIRDVWDGPECTTQQREVELTKEQRKLLSDLKNSLAIETRNGTQIIPANAAAARTKALQIILGAVYDDAHKAHELDASPRIEETLKVISQSKGKIIAFIGLTSVVDLVYKRLMERKVSCARVTGRTTDKERNAIFDAFQNAEEPRMLIADPGTMAHGLNLFAATTVLWFGPTDKTALYLQGNKRAHRPGQKHPVTVVQLVSSALEREIYKRLEHNESQQDALLSWIKGEQL